MAQQLHSSGLVWENWKSVSVIFVSSYTNVHGITVHNPEKAETVHMSTDRKMNKQKLRHNRLWKRTKNLAIEKNEVLPHDTMWRNLENVTLSGRSQTQKATQHATPLIRSVQNRWIQEAGAGQQLPGAGEVGWGVTAKAGCWVFWGVNGLELDGGGGCTWGTRNDGKKRDRWEKLKKSPQRQFKEARR